MLYVAEVSKNDLHFTIASSLSLVQDFIDDVAEYVQTRAIPVDEFSFKFALTEAVTNAIEHGNKKNPRRLVKFRLWEEEGSLRMSFEDEGSGFDWREYQDPSCPDSTAESGRGLFIIGQCGYEVEFNEAGNLVTLTHPLGDPVVSGI
ncbi:MAG: ATP-binding protein [Planctomycetia bacterium]|jgi:hypothetical protein